MKYEILIDEEFREDFYKRIDRAQHRIWLQFMTFEGDQAGLSLSERLIAAQKRGVDVKVVVDYYTDYFVSDTFYKNKLVRDEVKATQKMFQRLKEARVTLLRTRPYGPFLIYFASRNHKKLIIIDNICYLGGINISDHNYSWHDMMVRFEDPEIIKTVVKDYEATLRGERIILNENSIISNEAIKKKFLTILRDAQKEIIISSPYFINWALIKRAQKQDLKIKFLTVKDNNYSIINFLTRFIFPIYLWLNIEIYFYNRFSHAKFIIVDQKKVLLGSSNFCLSDLPYPQDIGICLEDEKFSKEFYEKLVLNPKIALTPYLRKISRSTYLLAFIMLSLITIFTYPLLFMYALFSKLTIKEITKPLKKS
jgi:cardiolipin synthase